LRAFWKCDSCGGLGHDGKAHYQGEWQPPEPYQCGDCNGGGRHPTPAFIAEQMADYVRADRAAAKVGANVAADDVSVLLGKALIDLRNNCKDEFLVNGVSHWIEGAMKIIAPGAPAETPKPVGEVIESSGQFDTAVSLFAPLPVGTMLYAAQPAPAATYCDSINKFLSETLEIHEKQAAFRDRFSKWLNLGCPLPDATPIAGDVEKDALDAARYRKIKADNDDCDAETFCLFFDSKSGGLISIESKDMDAELDAAMLANSSSGEAG
jgi:hypothetical protein